MKKAWWSARVRPAPPFLPISPGLKITPVPTLDALRGKEGGREDTRREQGREKGGEDSEKTTIEAREGKKREKRRGRKGRSGKQAVKNLPGGHFQCDL